MGNDVAEAKCDSEPNRWMKMRTTFGPALAGLIGGSLLGLVALPNMAALCRNMAATYASYPSLQRPWLAFEIEIPVLLKLLLIFVGLAGPITIGAVAVWLARTRDIWTDLSAGLSAALAATISAFAAGIGWPIVLAMVVAPSISDLTLLSQPRAAERGATSIGEHYPDLRNVEPEKRGELLMPKIVSDQSSGSAQAVWVGVLLSGLTAGLLAMSGALAAGYLRRRGDEWRMSIAPYLEMTVPATITAAVAAAAVLTPAWSVLIGENPLAVGWASLLGLMACAALLVIGAIQRWPWLVRLCVGLTWLSILIQARNDGVPWHMPVMAMFMAGALLWKYREVLRAGFSAVRA